MLDDNNLNELAEATSQHLNLSQHAVKKDFYVTQALQVLTRIKDDYFSLVFQGGTSLSKAYQAIRRLSEDIDFRVVQSPAALALGKDARRKRLRHFRHRLIQVLQDSNFVVDTDDVNVLYEGRFMSIKATYDEAEHAIYLKPHIAIDCFLGDIILPSQSHDVTTLIKLTLGEKCQHVSFPVVCIAIDETAAEKWVALTRRIANAEIAPKFFDKHLVRHLYDLHKLVHGNLLTGEYSHIVSDIINKDKQQFKHVNATYADDPIAVSRDALESLLKNNAWREHWNEFLTQMVYEEEKPSFETAYESLNMLSDSIFTSLKSDNNR
tara:strand:- start:78582 stop:79547 length:966 start_codon:yes stop_codon:yes gene_type:complete